MQTFKIKFLTDLIIQVKSALKRFITSFFGCQVIFGTQQNLTCPTKKITDKQLCRYVCSF